MSRTIRAIGITVLGCTLLVMMTACQATGPKACGPGGPQACRAQAGKTCPANCQKACCGKNCPANCQKACCAKNGKKCPANCKKACCGKKPCSTQAAAPQCGLDGCTKPGNPSIKAMVGGKEMCFCCAGCKAKATQKKK